jgi:hypothetical protein
VRCGAALESERALSWAFQQLKTGQCHKRAADMERLIGFAMVANAVKNPRVCTLEINTLSRPISRIFTTIRAAQIQLIQANAALSDPD